MAEVVDWNAELFIKLYSKIALALGVTPNSSADEELEELFCGPPSRRSELVGASKAESSQYLLAIYNPGQYLPVNMDPENNKNDRYALSTLLDVVPQFSWVFKQAATTVSNAYKSILDYKETPIIELNPDQKKKLEAATTTYAAYIDAYDTYADAYYVAMDAYDSAYATQENGGPKVPTSLKMKLKQAHDKWVAMGHKEAVEAATGVIAQLEALEPLSFWNKLKERYDTGTETTPLGSDFQKVGFAPPYKSWFADAGWTKFTFNQKDMDNQKKSDAIGVSGNLDMSYGIFKVSGDGSYEKDSKFVKMDQTELTFSCELMRISLDRGWMNPLVFSSTAWRWAKGTPASGVQFSTGGDMNDDVAPSGAMTVIPTAAILSRKVQINGKLDKTTVEEMNMAIKANASVGIGPFSIAGRFNMEDHNGSEKGTIAENGITANDVQIIALICEILPKSPNPDSNMVWPS